MRVGSYTLGRPWRPFAYVLYQNTSMSNVISQAGWDQWLPEDPRLGNCTFAEYANFGEGSVGPRISFGQTFDAPLKMDDILGSDYLTKSWYDASYF